MHLEKKAKIPENAAAPDGIGDGVGCDGRQGLIIAMAAIFKVGPVVFSQRLLPVFVLGGFQGIVLAGFNGNRQTFRQFVADIATQPISSKG